jgi:hypothetical protein
MGLWHLGQSDVEWILVMTTRLGSGGSAKLSVTGRYRDAAVISEHNSRNVRESNYLRSALRNICGLGHCRIQFPGAPVDGCAASRCRRSRIPKKGPCGYAVDMLRTTRGRVELTPQFDCVRMTGLNRPAIGSYSWDVRAATNFRCAEKSRIWLGGRYSMAGWRNGSHKGLYCGI